jgi:hypothetical protein
VNGVPQYTHAMSLARTSISSEAGIFQLLAMSGFSRNNVELRGLAALRRHLERRVMFFVHYRLW